MPLIFITGMPGAGKSAVESELRRLGQEAYDTDIIGAAYNNKTGAIAKIPPADERTPEWFNAHSWKLRRDRVEDLKQQAGNKSVFLCGTASNESEVLDLFDLVFLLDIDESTLKHRISTRAGNDYGKNEFELNEILQKHKDFKTITQISESK